MIINWQKCEGIFTMEVNQERTVEKQESVCKYAKMCCLCPAEAVLFITQVKPVHLLVQVQSKKSLFNLWLCTEPAVGNDSFRSLSRKRWKSSVWFRDERGQEEWLMLKGGYAWLVGPFWFLSTRVCAHVYQEFLTLSETGSLSKLLLSALSLNMSLSSRHTKHTCCCKHIFIPNMQTEAAAHRLLSWAKTVTAALSCLVIK